jgi:hypothetical protein
MRSEDELRDLLVETAREIAEFSDNPRSWLTWITFLMDQLDQQATNTGSMYQEIYQDLLYALQAAIRNRLSTGGW